MTDKQTIFLTWIIIFAVAFMGMVAVQEHVHSEFSETVDAVVLNGEYITVNHTHQRGIYFNGNDDYVRIDMDTGIAEYHESEKTTDDILNIHGFKDWTFEEKRMLTVMMMLTASPNNAENMLGVTFESVSQNASIRVLETYIDLLESAGY